MAKKRKNGVYCLEVGEWYGSLKKEHSVEPILDLLRKSPLSVPFIHRDIATEVELRYYLQKWTQGRHKDYPILYLAFHGSPGFIELSKENGRRDKLSTDSVFELLNGKCHQRVVHFGACSVLDVHGHTINRYLRESGAAAISGYRCDVDWIDSAIFEMAYLAQLQLNAFTQRGLKAVKRRINEKVQKLRNIVQFRMKIQ